MRAADYWDDAMEIDTYLARMTQRREQYESGIANAELPAEVRETFGGRPLRFLILTEDYCGDSAQFIPLVMRLARELDNVDVRLLLRNSHRDLAANYLRRDGYQPIPVLILLDEHGEELGALIERPLRMYDEMAAETRRFAQQNQHLEGVNRNYQQMPPETLAAVVANMDAYRAGRIGTYLDWLWEDLTAIAAMARVKAVSAD